jgi:hypothetical protein
MYHDGLDACPAVVTFFHSVSGLAFLHRLVIVLHVVCVEIGACGIRLVCLVLELTGLNRFVGASYGTQQQVRQLDLAPPASFAMPARLIPSYSLDRVASTRTVTAGEPLRA